MGHRRLQLRQRRGDLAGSPLRVRGARGMTYARLEPNGLRGLSDRSHRNPDPSC
jgi:hypothetical protein